MKVTKQKEITCCDFCGDEGTYEKCRACGKDVCYECQKTQGVEYPHSVYCSGSGDGFYCHSCDKSANDQLHKAYRAIQALRRENDGFYADFRNRTKAAEDRLKELLGK